MAILANEVFRLVEDSIDNYSQLVKGIFTIILIGNSYE